MDYVLFDLDDTLYDQAEPFVRAYEEVFGTHEGIDPYQVFPVSREYSEAVFEASERGEMPMEQMYVYRIQRALAEFGFDAPDEDCLRMHYRYAELQESSISFSPTICTILDLCAERSKVAIVSNGPAEHQLKKMDVLDVYRWVDPSAVFVSSVLGFGKPDPRHLWTACERLGTHPDGCVLVGDSYNHDVVGAQRAGMPMVWFNRHARPANGDAQATWKVSTEEELLELLTSLL